MGFVKTTDGTEIFYKDWGPKDAQPVVFHHGWPLSGDDWDAQMLFFLFVSLKAYGGDDGMTIRRRNELFGLNTRDDLTFYFICLTVAALVFLVMLVSLNRRMAQIERSGKGSPS